MSVTIDSLLSTRPQRCGDCLRADTRLLSAIFRLLPATVTWAGVDQLPAAVHLDALTASLLAWVQSAVTPALLAVLAQPAADSADAQFLEALAEARPSATLAALAPPAGPTGTVASMTLMAPHVTPASGRRAQRPHDDASLAAIHIALPLLTAAALSPRVLAALSSDPLAPQLLPHTCNAISSRLSRPVNHEADDPDALERAHRGSAANVWALITLFRTSSADRHGNAFAIYAATPAVAHALLATVSLWRWTDRDGYLGSAAAEALSAWFAADPSMPKKELTIAWLPMVSLVLLKLLPMPEELQQWDTLYSAHASAADGGGGAAARVVIAS